METYWTDTVARGAIKIRKYDVIMLPSSRSKNVFGVTGIEMNTSTVGR